MDIFRSKKRGSESASVGELTESQQKRHRNLSGSVGDLLESAEDSQDEVFTDDSTTDSEPEDVQKASKMQKIFAKKLIKRDKRKEKEHRKKVEKNLISMDDFLRKQSEFKMWLYEEKSKNAGTLSSPKLKSYFKQFMRLWNKHKLQAKYYKSSTLPESPRTPLASKDLNFLSGDQQHVSGPLDSEGIGAEVKKEPPTSPFVTFGKTPPKVFKSKKLQLFGSNPDVALISVAPLDQGITTVDCNKDKPSKEELCEYRIPSMKSQRTSSNKHDTPSPQFIGATPYKVSVFSWAVGETSDCDQSLNVCSTETPPNLSHAGQDDQEDWPPPPSETEINCQSTSDSPHVPPPPPPRKDSLPQSIYDDVSVKSSRSDYSDPYDKLTEKPFYRESGHYQDPVDCIVDDKNIVNQNSKRVLKGFMSENDEPDSTLYSKPVVEKRISKDELEEMYAKPIKKLRKASGDSLITNIPEKVDTGSSGGLYAEIMAHFERKNLSDKVLNNKKETVNDPHYESIDDVFRKSTVGIAEDKKCKEIIENYQQDSMDNSSNVINEMKKLPEFSGLEKNKKKTILAASSDKIYETYLSLGSKVNPFKSKQVDKNCENGSFSYGTLKKRHKSQPDISVSENIKLYENVEFQADSDRQFKTENLFFSSFKDSYHCHSKREEIIVSSCPKLSEQQKSQSCEDNLGVLSSPSTPIIMATPSFESLCKVTPLSARSQSSQSLPTKSGSSDNLSASDSFMSTSTNSSLSYGIINQTGSVQSLQSDKSLSPVQEETESSLKELMKTVTETDKPIVPGIGTLTPGKANVAKLGIDLSVYLLKPNQHGENGNNIINHETGTVVQTEKISAHSKINVNENQTRLAIKDTLSGVKTKVDTAKTGTKKEADRRHTVQTIQEMKEGYIIQKKPDNPTQLPNIGVNGKVRKLESHNLSADKNGNRNIEKLEPDSKRHCAEKRACGKPKDNYLETDIDTVVEEKPRPKLRKSKSHSGFPTGSTSNVVTEIW